MQEYTLIQNLAYCARQSAFRDKSRCEARRAEGRQTAVAKDREHYDYSRLGFGRR
jgi:hypothetical protein